MAYKIGKDTLVTPSCPAVLSTAAVGAQKEGEGPLGKEFDLIEEDSRFGQETWEKAESKMQELACKVALGKANRKMSGMDFIFAGDLLNQCIASAYGARSSGVPFIGLYGACSTFT
ncbi:MAG TPA: stage V sporulation protein AD, partial [Oscillospiraceae bacterium]|nr:stage V sporulation protein AD [Oscillospiraceae bacterium]